MTVVKKVPIVAIIGRANVGKSSLFNALLQRRQAIVAAEPGTTRDRVTAKLSLNDRDLWLVDTAGLKEAEDDFEVSLQAQISEAAVAANLILVVIEAAALTDEDRRVATLALKTGQPVILVANKIDRARGAGLADWAKLGIKTIVPTSVSQKRGLDQLLTELRGQLPRIKEPVSAQALRLALLGRPNVGKSSLFNTLAAKQQAPWNARQRRAGLAYTSPIPQGQALVAERAGTTRDVNEVNVRYHDQDLVIMDTAGIRRSGKIGTGVEHFSVLRALAAIEEADIGVVIIDATEPSVAQDQKIAGLVKQAGRGLIIAVNKADLLTEGESSKLIARVSEAFRFTPWAPLVLVSAQTGLNATKLFELASELAQARQQTIPTAKLNRWLQTVVNDHPPAGLRGKLPHLSYIVQETDHPLNFKIFGRDSRSLHWSYKRYLERRFRERWPFAGWPLNFWFFDKTSTSHQPANRRSRLHR